MQINQPLLMEYEYECGNTRKLLETVPFDNPAWKPNEKSMSLVELATHVAEIPAWMHFTLDFPELDFAKSEYKLPKINNVEELLALHDKTVAEALSVLAKATDEQMMENWTMRNGEQIYFTMPKASVLRSWVFNHLYHHRGQLTVYLRLLNVPLVGMYGPTADDKM